MTVPRLVVVVYTVGLIVALVGGAFLFARLSGVTDRSNGVVCTLGKAVSSSKIEQRAEENLREFRARVALLRKFTRDLRDLDADCDVPPAEGVRLSPKDRARLHADRVKGGGASASPPGSSQPGPPSGGPSGGGNGGDAPPTNPPSNPPPDNPGLLDPVCDLTSGLGLPLC